MKNRVWLVVALLGVLELGVGAFLVFHALDMQSWPKTKGVVVVSKMHDFMRKNSDGTRTRIYSAKVHYRYKVKGKSYTGNTIASRGQFSNIQSVPEKILKKYPLHRKIDVFYNPKKPKHSVLVREGFGIILGFMIMGVIVLLVGLWGLYAQEPKKNLLSPS